MGKRRRWRRFNPRDSTTLPKGAGVYVVHLHGRAIYIGSSTTLSHRYRQHIHGLRYSEEKNWPAIMGLKGKYFSSKKFGDWAMIELRLVRRLRPDFNTRHVQDQAHAATAAERRA